VLSLNVQRLRCSSLVAVMFIASVAAPAHLRGQDTVIPFNRLVFRSSSLEFRPEGTFLLHSVLEGIGEMRATGTWKYQSGAIELAGHDIVAGAELLKAVAIPLDGCGTAGQYRFEVNGKQLRLLSMMSSARIIYWRDSRILCCGVEQAAPQARKHGTTACFRVYFRARGPSRSAQTPGGQDPRVQARPVFSRRSAQDHRRIRQHRRGDRTCRCRGPYAPRARCN